jgi:hypothetical protein
LGEWASIKVIKSNKGFKNQKIKDNFKVDVALPMFHNASALINQGNFTAVFRRTMIEGIAISISTTATHVWGILGTQGIHGHPI